MLCLLSLTYFQQNTFADVVYLLAAGGSVITAVFIVTVSALFLPAPVFIGPIAAELGALVLAIGFYVSIIKV